MQGSQFSPHDAIAIIKSWSRQQLRDVAGDLIRQVPGVCANPFVFVYGSRRLNSVRSGGSGASDFVRTLFDSSFGTVDGHSMVHYLRRAVNDQYRVAYPVCTLSPGSKLQKWTRDHLMYFLLRVISRCQDDCLTFMQLQQYVLCASPMQGTTVQFLHLLRQLAVPCIDFFQDNGDEMVSAGAAADDDVVLASDGNMSLFFVVIVLVQRHFVQILRLCIDRVFSL